MKGKRLKTEGNDLLRDKCQKTESVNDLSNNKTFVNSKIGCPIRRFMSNGVKRPKEDEVAE